MTIIEVRVKPGARRDALIPLPDGAFVAEVKAPPIDGKANAALIALIAAHFGVPKRRVSIRAGAGARRKRVEIAP
ncbi:MAG: DUF167 domain-containing protein [Gammaproteobacteria bacterium]